MNTATDYNLKPQQLLPLLLTITSLLSASSSNIAVAKANNQSEPIKVGFITSLSGVAAIPGHDMANGISLFVDQYNAKTKGRKIQLLIENDGSNPATAVAKVSKLVEKDKVKVIAGALLANVGYAIAPMTDRYQVPFIAAIAAGDDMTQRKHFNWMIRTSATSSQPLMAFGDYAYNKLNYRRVIAIAMDYEFGWEQVGGFQKTFEDAGGKVVQKIWAPLGFTDFAPCINSINTDADAVFILGVGKFADVLVKQFKELGPKIPVIGGPTSFDECILRTSGREMLGSVSPQIYSAALNTPNNRRFVEAYRRAFHQDPSFYAEGAYTSGLFMEKAFASLHDDLNDAKKLLSSLKQVEVSAPRGTVRLDNRANAIETIYIRKVEDVNGKLQNTVVASFPNVSQFWTYNQAQYLKQPNYSRSFPPCKYCSPHAATVPSRTAR